MLKIFQDILRLTPSTRLKPNTDLPGMFDADRVHVLLVDSRGRVFEAMIAHAAFHQITNVRQGRSYLEELIEKYDIQDIPDDRYRVINNPEYPT